MTKGWKRFNSATRIWQQIKAEHESHKAGIQEFEPNN